jgi:hypothetical protein
MIDFDVFLYWNEVERMFPKKVRLAMARRAEDSGNGEVAKVFADYETWFNRAVRDVPTWTWNGMTRIGGLLDSLSRKQANAVKFIQNTEQCLKAAGSFLLPHQFTAPALTAQTARGEGRGILEAIADCGGQWILQAVTALCSQWVSEAAARLHIPVEVFRIRNKTSGTSCDFYIWEENHAHILFFQVAPQNQARFWITRRDLKDVFRILLEAGFEKLSADVLTNPEQYPLSPTRREWRSDLVEADGVKMRKLMLLWRRLGGIPFKAVQGCLPDAIILVAPHLAPEAKAQFEKAGLGNPYALLAHSVYDEDLEKQLKGNARQKQ